MALAHPLHSDFVQEIKSLAKAHQIYVSIGIHEKSNEARFYNSHLCVID